MQQISPQNDQFQNTKKNFILLTNSIEKAKSEFNVESSTS